MQYTISHKKHFYCILSIIYYNLAPRLLDFFSCSTQLSTNLQLLIKTKIPKVKKFHALSFSDVVFIILTDVKMQIIAGILTFMSRINFVLS